MDFPRIVITDANIWIDLHWGGITSEAFKLDRLFKTSDLVAHEILSLAETSLKRMGLQVVELSGVQVLEIVRMARIYPRPSRPDLSALVLAHTEEAILLTGDKALRSAAEIEGVEVRGLLWLLDEMVGNHVLTAVKAIVALQQILDKGSRLPQADCDRCIQRWRSVEQ